MNNEAYNARLELALSKLDPVADAEVLAVLAQDVDSCTAYRHGHEVQLDVDDTQLVDSPTAAHGITLVTDTARWKRVDHVHESVDTFPATHIHPSRDSARLATVGVQGPYAGAVRITGLLDADKLHRADAARTQARDKAAFPYLWNAKGQRVNLDSTRSYNAARGRMGQR